MRCMRRNILGMFAVILQSIAQKILYAALIKVGTSPTSNGASRVASNVPRHAIYSMPLLLSDHASWSEQWGF